MDFERTVKAHHGMVYGIAYNLSNNAAIAEEIAQDVFLRLYERGPELQSDSHLMSWLRRTTTHRAIDFLRRRSTRGEVQMEVVPDVADDQHADADPLLNGRLKRLVASLPERQRAVVVLRFGQDMDIDEIGQVLDLPNRTVRTHLQRAVALLRAKTENSLARGR